MNPLDSSAGAVRPGHSLLARLSALASLVAVTAAIGHLLNAWLDPVVELRRWVEHAGPAGPLLFIGLFLALNTLGIPLPVLGAAAGVAYDPVRASAIALAAMTPP